MICFRKVTLTICSHRSAISAFHNKVNGRKIGEHPEVNSLIAGVFNRRPPQPKYTFIWGIQTIITLVKNNWANNSLLSDKDLTLKLTILLALTSGL